MLGLLFDTDDAITIEDWNSEALRVRNFLQDDVAASRIVRELLVGRDDIVLDDVVSQNYANGLSVSKVPCKTQRIRELWKRAQRRLHLHLQCELVLLRLIELNDELPVKVTAGTKR